MWKIIKYVFIIIVLTNLRIQYSYAQAKINPDEKKKLVDSSSILIDLAGKFRNAGDFENFAKLIKKSYLIKEHKASGPYDPLLANSLVNMAIAYSSFWENDSAIHYLNQAERIYLNDKISNKGYLGYVYALTGQIYFKNGDFEQARAYYENSEQLLKDINREPFLGLKILLFFWFGELERTLYHPENALLYYQKSLHIIESSKAYSNRLIYYYIETALVYSQSKNNYKSVQLQRQALDICRKDTVLNIIQLVQLFTNISDDYLMLNNYIEAEKYYKEAVSISKKAGLKGSYYSELLLHMGRMEEKRQNYLKAMDNYQSALKTLILEFKPANAFDNPDPKKINAVIPALNLLKLKADCFTQLFYKQTYSVSRCCYQYILAFG